MSPENDSSDDDVVVAGIFDGALCDDVSEPCPDRDCSGHGSVTEGKCRCDDGYESEKCDRCASTHYEEEAVRGVLALISFSYLLTQRTHSCHIHNQ